MPPHFLRGSSALVIRCFKRVEAFADWITGAAGPVFVVLCWVLIGAGGFAFFDVVARDMPLRTLLLGSWIFLLTPLNLYGQYYLVTTIPPGFPSPKASGMTPRERWLIPSPRSIWSVERWGFRKRGKALSGGGNAGAPRRVRRCRKCDGPKPERAHHCSVCKRCVLQMDHHCPWINACVGLHNQRHFVLFMAWLSLACWVVAITGYAKFWASLDARAPWPSYTPSILWTLIWVLSVAIGVAVPILGSWHLWMVAAGETSIESHDNDYLSGKAKAEGLIYLNPFDLGKRRNLEIFFTLGEDGYTWPTLLLPWIVPPMSNGWSYPRRALPSAPSSARREMHLHSPELAVGLIGAGTAENGMGSEKYVMDDGGYDLTDDEEGGGGWMDAAPPTPSH